MTEAVELQGLTRRFGTVTVLNSISLAVPAGEVVAIYGRSGSGKTTLVNLIGGLDRPDGGTVLVDGVDLSTLSTAALSELRRTQMGLVFQSFGLLSHLSAWQNVEFGLRLAGCPRRGWRERTAAALAAVGLTARARHVPAELSGGERQRVAIARALAPRPRIVLADEPTGALDHANSQAIASLLVAYAREAGATVWIATHDTGVAELADRVYRINAGRLVPEARVPTDHLPR